MENLTILNVNGGLMIDSREVAFKIDKRHDNLMRDIKGYVDILTNSTLRSLDFFIEDTYVDMKGETRPCYLMTKKGCDMVANKLTGEKGVLFTAEYINAFEDMKTHIETSNQLATKDVTVLIQDLSEGLEEVKSYYRMPHREKLNINKRIKSMLGAKATAEEVKDVKEYVFLCMGIISWEDLPIKQRSEVLDLIDKRCKLIVDCRPTLFNWNEV